MSLSSNTEPATSHPGNAPSALVVSKARVAYPDGPDVRVVLDDLDLSVSPGEIVVISGESGAGKSTLLTIAGLLRRPDSGEVTVAGIPTSALSERQRTVVRRDEFIGLRSRRSGAFPDPGADVCKRDPIAIRCDGGDAGCHRPPSARHRLRPITATKRWRATS